MGLIETLGIRSGTLFATWVGEIIACLAAAVALSWGIGSLGLYLLCKGIERWMPGYESTGTAGVGVYIWTLAGTALLGSVWGMPRLMRCSGDPPPQIPENAAAKWEPVTGRFTIASAVAAGILGILCLSFYGQRRMAESLVLACGFLLCAAIVFRSLWGLWMKRGTERSGKDSAGAAEDLPDALRFRTVTRYLSLLTVVHVLCLSVFSVKFLSARIADDPEDLYPYDYVYLANGEDDRYFKQLEEECGAEVYQFPMVRATTLDNTEMPNQFTEIVVQQGQNIGISETTYRALKELAGEDVEDLLLDDAGRRIHVVYQQDQAARAKPLDWFQWTGKPYVHIGQALMGHDIYTRAKTYPPREIISEERGSLIGAFRQGKYENLIVFSDAYFEAVKDSWRTTDLLTGEPVSEKDAVPDVTIHEWPTRLCLVNVPEEYRAQADEILEEFRTAHAFDEQFDPLVKSAYIGQRRAAPETDGAADGNAGEWYCITDAVGGGDVCASYEDEDGSAGAETRLPFFCNLWNGGKRKDSSYETGGVTVCVGAACACLWDIPPADGNPVEASAVSGGRYGRLSEMGASGMGRSYVLAQVLNMKLLQKNVNRELEGEE